MIADFPAMMLVAIAVDRLIGWPDWLYRRIGHPVTWGGRLISSLEARLNQARFPRRLTGAVTLGLCLIAVLLPSIAMQLLLPGNALGVVAGGLLAWPLVAVRSMHDHVVAVEKPLIAGDLPGARRAVSMIVGRDPDRLDAAGVSRAAIESLAENASDGVVAPVSGAADPASPEAAPAEAAPPPADGAAEPAPQPVETEPAAEPAPEAAAGAGEPAPEAELTQ